MNEMDVFAAMQISFIIGGFCGAIFVHFVAVRWRDEMLRSWQDLVSMYSLALERANKENIQLQERIDRGYDL